MLLIVERFEECFLYLHNNHNIANHLNFKTGRLFSIFQNVVFEVKNNFEIIKKVKGTPYQDVLRSALERGGRSFATANYLMQSRFPEYREKINEDENQ